MASDLTPEELAEEMRQLRYVVRHPMTGDDYPVDTKVIRKLLDMAERCADYDRRLGAVMPADFKDWHQNGPKEWPEVAAGVVTNLRERLEQAEESSIDAERVAIERSQDA